MRDVISLRGLEVFAHHGVFDHERAEGQTFVVDVEVEYDASAPAQSDEVADTLDYGVLASRIHEAVAGNPVNLLETLCQRVISTVLVRPTDTPDGAEGASGSEDQDSSTR